MKYLIVLILSLASLSAFAASRTVTLDVPGMTCQLCPITVKRSLEKVRGVSKIDVSFEDKRAVVTYDDALTSGEELTKATANAGYPSTVKK